MIRYLPVALVLLLLSLSACIEDRESVSVRTYTDTELAILSEKLHVDAQPVDYQLRFPKHMQELGLRPQEINNHLAMLGRVLFYDTRLSKTNEVSCASCHDQGLAFADDEAFSKGFAGSLTKRNSISLAATANFSTSYDASQTANGEGVFFFWDERAQTIVEQSSLTITDPIEMGLEPAELEQRLREDPMYSILAKRAFRSNELSFTQVLLALQEFCNSISSTNSKFDDLLNWRVGHQVGSNPFTQQELLGRGLFIDHCSSCHSRDMTLSSKSIANNGLDLEYADKGVGAHRRVEAFDGFFKIPMLRNIAVTAPYMHDGRFATLEEVIDHYNTGIANHPNLSDDLKDPSTNAPKRNFLTEGDKQALTAFLHTLTDYEFLADERFSDPFKR